MSWRRDQNGTLVPELVDWMEGMATAKRLQADGLDVAPSPELLAQVRDERTPLRRHGQVHGQAWTRPRRRPTPGQPPSPRSWAGPEDDEQTAPLVEAPPLRRAAVQRLRLRLRGRRPFQDPVTASAPVSIEAAMSARIWNSVGC
jgi:hypothetical protein